MPQRFPSLAGVHLKNAWLTIGVFDGIHRGHQQLINQLTAGAHANSAPAVVLTFHPHPAQVLAGKNIPCLTTPDERADLLFNQGVDAVIGLEFTHQLAHQSAEDFMAALKKHLDLQHLLIGYDFALGRDRAGNFERLSQIGQQLGYSVSALEPFQLDQEIISSTLIRQCITEGAVNLAAHKLGRFYGMTGPVISGDGRGRTIGIPTANVDVSPGKAMPANGVYACRAITAEGNFKAVVNIGLRPTFTSGEVLPRVEAHLLDYAADLYGQTITLEFVERLRPEQKFPSIQALIAQIQTDITRARQIL